MSKVLVSHAVGNANVRALLDCWHHRQQLHSYWTTVGTAKNTPWLDLLPGLLQKEVRRRSYNLPQEMLKNRPWRELARQVSLRADWATWHAHETGWASIDAVCQDLDRWVAKKLTTMPSPPQIIYGYEDTSCLTFRTARSMGLRRIYEITIGHHASFQRIMQEESELMPEFAGSLEALWDSAEKLRRKDEELTLADLIVASSDFVRMTLLAAGVEAKKIVVSQFGAPDGVWPKLNRSRPRSGPLRLLFAGRITQRKGIGYLLQALQRLNRVDVELILLGQFIGPKSQFEPYARWFRYETPRPHAEVLKLMQGCDLLVLPTLFEGQALVILEAMKCGLPVLTTTHSGAANLIQNGRQGFLVPIRAVEALMEKISWAADHREELLQMGIAAQERAMEYNWQQYAEKISVDIGLGVFSS